MTEPRPDEGTVTERETTERSVDRPGDAPDVTERETTERSTEVDREDDAPDAGSLTDEAPADPA